MAEEQFCPAIPVATYDTLDEAILRANKTPFGLSGSVWSRDTEKALAVARSIEAGQVWVNTHGVLAINHLAPYQPNFIAAAIVCQGYGCWLVYRSSSVAGCVEGEAWGAAFIELARAGWAHCGDATCRAMIGFDLAPLLLNS
jgi:hypothetical protein